MKYGIWWTWVDVSMSPAPELDAGGWATDRVFKTKRSAEKWLSRENLAANPRTKVEIRPRAI